MEKTIVVGTRIVHPVYGAGVVRRKNGSELLVRFDVENMDLHGAERQSADDEHHMWYTSVVNVEIESKTAKFNAGDKVYFKDTDSNRALHIRMPQYFPLPMTVGTIITCSEREDSDALVQWANGSTEAPDRWFAMQEDIALVEEKKRTGDDLRIGDIVVAKDPSVAEHYSITNEDMIRGEVTGVDGQFIMVKVLDHKDTEWIGKTYTVVGRYFKIAPPEAEKKLYTTLEYTPMKEAPSKLSKRSTGDGRVRISEKDYLKVCDLLDEIGEILGR